MLHSKKLYHGFCESWLYSWALGKSYRVEPKEDMCSRDRAHFRSKRACEGHCKPFGPERVTENRVWYESCINFLNVHFMKVHTISGKLYGSGDQLMAIFAV